MTTVIHLKSIEDFKDFNFSTMKSFPPKTFKSLVKPPIFRWMLLDLHPAGGPVTGRGPHPSQYPHVCPKENLTKIDLRLDAFLNECLNCASNPQNFV